MSVLHKTVYSALMLIAWSLTASPAGAEVPTQFDMLRELGLSLGEHEQVRSGQVVSLDLPRKRGDELAAAAVVLLPAGIADAAQAMLSLETHSETDSGSASGGAAVPMQVPVQEPVREEHWQDAVYAPPEADEAARLRSASPGDRFNLSFGEIERLRALGETDNGGLAPGRIRVSQTYRELLMQRLRSYAAKGLDGVPGYARGDGDVRSPAQALRDALAQAEPLLRARFPEFTKALERYPEPVPGIEHRLLWKKDEVNGRPAFILRHDVIDRGGGYFLLGRRVFYVSHSYNAMQDIALLLPVRGGTTMYRFVRTYTDRVAGVFNGFERALGQKMMKESLAEDAKSLQMRLTKQRVARGD